MLTRISSVRQVVSRSFSVSSKVQMPKKKEEAEPAKPVGLGLGGVDSTYGGGVRSGGGAFGKREGVMEEQWAYEHDKEMIRRLAARLKQMEKVVADAGIQVPAPTKDTHIPALDDFEYESVEAAGSQPRGELGPNPLLDAERSGAGSGFSSRGNAEEDRYMYEKDKDNVRKFKK